MSGYVWVSLSQRVCVCVCACMRMHACMGVCVWVCVGVFYDFELLRRYVQFNFWLCIHVQDQTTTLIPHWAESSIMLTNNRCKKLFCHHIQLTMLK